MRWHVLGQLRRARHRDTSKLQYAVGALAHEMGAMLADVKAHKLEGMCSGVDVAEEQATS